MHTQQQSQNVGRKQLSEIKNQKPELEVQIAQNFLFGAVGEKGLNGVLGVDM